ncbi:MAG TPA: hypothetical protein EYG92_05210 [Lutibacter sp.]|nr:hypothetical protein [Lutibacter sp.]
MANVSAVINSIRNIMRQDRGISGDAQRLEQLGWMLFLKIIDDKDQELEIIKDDYESVIPEKFQWRNWAADPEGITGDELLDFIDSNAHANIGLFATLRELTNTKNPKRAAIVREVFEGSNNYMKSGYEMRKVINKLNEIDFNNSKDKHIFGDIYENILQELRDAGNKGEYYTPRAITQLMTQMTDPKLGEKVLDPAAGTGGFLTSAIDHIRTNYVKTVDDEHILQKSITGWELKPVAYVLGLTNLILHEIDLPDYIYKDSLKTEYNSISRKDQVDVILANPPFGATIADGVETNFPTTYRTKESADLFVVLMLQLLKPKGRAAIVLPDGSITGDGIKARIREKLLTECNLHTIIRLPQSTFFPATVSTNLLFFEKGSPTKEIWYYEHRLPEGQKSYSKTKPIRFEEFKPLIEWWNNRKESEVAWKVNIEELKNWDLDIKNPNVVKIEIGNPKEYLKLFKENEGKFENFLDEIIEDLEVNHSVLNNILSNHKYLFKNSEVVKQLKQSILQEAIQGKLTEDWRKQNPNVEPASELLKRIKAEKEKLIKEKKIRKEKPLPPITKEEIPFELPEKWIWCRFKEIVNFQLGKTPSSKQTSYWTNGTIDWLNISDMVDGGFIYKTSKKITEKAVKDVFKTQSIVPIDTLLMSFKLTVGKVSINKIPLFHNEAIISIYPYTGVLQSFLFNVLPVVTNLSVSKKVLMGQTFNSTSLANMVFPLPPKEEQKAIVEKVESLMQKVSAMEDEIKKSEENAQMLMQAVLKEAF